jgi:hypothetical protein
MLIRSRTFLFIAICAMSGCSRGIGPVSAGKTHKPSPFQEVNSRPEDITVLSGTTFRWGQVNCQLLGVKEKDDPADRKQAEEFTRAWFKSIGKLIAVYNETNPLVTDDGTAIVWIRGYDCYLSCLSEELVRAGLVEIDDSPWENYTYTVPTKPGEEFEDWRGILRKAKEGHKQGEKLRVLFEWPPK